MLYMELLPTSGLFPFHSENSESFLVHTRVNNRQGLDCKVKLSLNFIVQGSSNNICPFKQITAPHPNLQSDEPFHSLSQANFRSTEEVSPKIEASLNPTDQSKCELPGKSTLSRSAEAKKLSKGLKVTKNLVEVLIGLVQGKVVPISLNQETEIFILKCFLSNVSHKNNEQETLSLIESMNLKNYREVLQKLRKSVCRHRKNENIRTVFTLMHKFVRSRRTSVRHSELEPLRKYRYSEMRVKEKCKDNPSFYKRFCDELNSERFLEFSVSILRTQFAKYLLRWVRHFNATKEWKARFVAFPVEIMETRRVFSNVHM